MLKTTLIIAALMLVIGGAQAFQLNTHTPTIHQLNPQLLPPGARAFGSGGGAGRVSLGGGFGPGNSNQQTRPAQRWTPCTSTTERILQSKTLGRAPNATRLEWPNT